jgi:acetyl-CoA acetyltransferase
MLRRAATGTCTLLTSSGAASRKCLGVSAEHVDNVIAGFVYQIGEQSAGITRNAWLQMGLPADAGATTVDIRCGSGQQAVHFAALRILAGMDDVAVAGGVEHMDESASGRTSARRSSGVARSRRSC